MNRRRFYLDLAERTSWTFVQAGAASILVFGWTWDSLKLAGAAGLGAVVKGVAASRIGDSDSAAALPGVEGQP